MYCRHWAVKCDCKSVLQIFILGWAHYGCVVCQVKWLQPLHHQQTLNSSSLNESISACGHNVWGTHQPCWCCCIVRCKSSIEALNQSVQSRANGKRIKSMWCTVTQQARSFVKLTTRRRSDVRHDSVSVLSCQTTQHSQQHIKMCSAGFKCEQLNFIHKTNKRNDYYQTSTSSFLLADALKSWTSKKDLLILYLNWSSIFI